MKRIISVEKIGGSSSSIVILAFTAIMALTLVSGPHALYAQDRTPPTAPSGLTASAASETQINLSWNASIDIVGVTGYQVQRCQGASCTSFSLVATVTGTNYNNTGLRAGTSYRYRVRATDAAGNLSGFSNIAAATTLDTTPPTAPSNLTASAVNGTRINLAWTVSTDNVGVNGYQVERCQGTGCTNFALLTTVTGTTYNNTGLTNGTRYSYRVRARDAAGNLSGYSNTASATTTDTSPPTSPTGLTATAVNGSQINLSWTASTDNVGVTAYQVQRCQGASCTSFTQVATVTGTAYSDTQVQAGTTYRYRVRATDAAGNLSGFSNIASATTPQETTPPTAPSNLTALAASSTQINLAWSASTDNVGVTGYQVERCQGAGCSSFTQIGAATGTTYNNTGLTNGTSYSYRVRARDAAGNLSGYSNTASATTTDTSSPTAPTGLTATTVSGSQINLSWTASSDNVGVTGYLVESCRGAGCSNFTQIGTATGTTYNNTGLTNGTSYSYRVRATDAAGNLSGYSNIASATTTDTSPPTAPTNLTASTGSSSQINLSWTASTDNVGVTGYLVESCQGTGCSSFALVTTVTGTTYNNTGLVAGTSCSYRVRATDAAGNLSLYSNTASATTTAADTTPPTVTVFTIPAIASTLTVPISSFTATDNVGVTGYVVTESSTAPSASSAGWLTTPLASYACTTAGSKTLYAWAKDAANNVSASKSASVVITLQGGGVEPAGWFTGDMHVHRSCGGSPEAISSIYDKMSPNNLGCVSLLADMGNGEVQDPATDLPRVNGQDDPVSTPGRTVHWDAEWHWDATYTQYPHQALGGHVVALGLTEAHQIWQEYTYPIFNWAHQQNAIAGFVHMQYLDNNIPQSLDCCTPIEYPVEVALGSADFIAEDVNGGESAIQAYYRLLNTGFRPGLAAGTDYPCGVSELGSLLTYVQVAGGQFTYRNWIEGIARGRTVISRNGHNEFLNLTVNDSATPGDEIKLTVPGSVQVTVTWTANQTLTGTIELVSNGVVVASQQGTVTASSPGSLTAAVNFTNSGWLAARRMDSNGHVVHTAAVFVTVNNAPVRASVTDAQFYVQWMDNLLTKTSPGGGWNSYFPTSLSQVQARYQAAKALFQQIALEAGGSSSPTLSSITVIPGNQTITSGSTQQFTATGTYSDRSTLNLTAQTNWASSNTNAAAINRTGLALGANPDSTTISATLNGITGSTALIVQAAPLTITTQSLPGGTLNLAYSTTLGASGGTKPYTWSITSGSLPGGLGLDSGTGIISGTPTAAGAFSFTLQVSDSASPALSATRALSITVSATQTFTIWSNTTVPDVISDPETGGIELGVKFRSDANGFISGLQFYKSAQNTGTHTGILWNATGTLLASVTFTNETASGWQYAAFSTPVAIAANTTYVASYYTSVGHYSVTEGYFATSGSDNPPLHALANGVDGPNGVYKYGASGFPNQTYNSTNYWVDVTFSSNAPPDTTPPTVSSVYPSSGASGIDPGGTVRATFSEAMNAATTSASTFYLRDPSSALIPATVTYDGTTKTAILAPSATLAVSTTYTAMVKGGSGGVKDAAGNTMLADYTWSFTTASSQIVTDSVWSNTTVPAVISDSDSSAIELGVKFRSDVAGFITGLRFYKGAQNTGTHTGNLWTATGTLIASVTFTNETASGWQQVSLPTSVAINANTTYVASYFTTVGHYSANEGYFASSGSDNPPLHALANGVDGPNGVYKYGTSGFPNQSYNSTNYWVDVVFQTTLPPDTTPPMVSSGSPSNGTSGVDAGTSVAAIFSEAMNAATINASTFTLRDSNGPVQALVTYDSGTRRATLAPTAPLAFSTPYTATIKGGAGGVTDVAGNTMVADFTSSFITAGPPPPPPGQGPGGPILVIANSANPFTSYYAEILRTEGLNAFTVMDISQITLEILSGYDVAILGEMPLTDQQEMLINQWVVAGGHLIAMRPDKKLAPLLGLTDLSSTLSNAYLLVNTTSGPGQGIVNQTIQFHGTADLYGRINASSLADLYSNATTRTPTQSPAVTLQSVGTNGGQVAAFTYDLARSVVYTRQGNPAWSGEERDGVSPIRSDDLFFGAASGDSKPDWVDLNKVAIPQADEQQRLLANLIIQMNFPKKPLPRFWYFPRSFPAVVIMTGDDHDNGGTAGRFDNYTANSLPGCSVQNWECIRGTSYIYPGTITDAQAAAYNAAGFEVALHVLTDCADWTPSSLATFYADQLTLFRTDYPDLASPSTNRTHCIAWSDYDTQPQVELANGIRLDTNYYYWPPTWISDRPGFFTGSGMPMRFTKSDGTFIDVYQATTQMTDESGQSYPFTIDSLLDKAIGPEGYYGAFTVNAHTDSATSSVSDAVIASALARNIPVVSARQMLQWLDGRNGSSFGAITWNGSKLTFSISVGQNANGLMAMVPIPLGSTVSSISQNGNPLAYSTAVIKGVQYAFIYGTSGSYQVTFASDTTPPVVSSVSPSSGASGVGIGANVTATFSKAMDSSTITASTFVLQDPLGVPMSAAVTYDPGTKTATLTPTASLAVSTTYTATIKGGAGRVKDVAGNIMAADYTWSFTTGAQITIWSNSVVPAVVAASDTSAIELGLKFRSDVPGNVTGIRFYKSSSNTGTHVGNLWTSTGLLLASVAFTDETGSGWQQVSLPTPVAITPNTTYVVSYHTNVGYYSANSGYFASSGTSNGPLHALANGVDGPNGVYLYGSGSGFPNQSYNSTNYWVDVVFQP